MGAMTFYVEYCIILTITSFISILTKTQSILNDAALTLNAINILIKSLAQKNQLITWMWGIKSYVFSGAKASQSNTSRTMSLLSKNVKNLLSIPESIMAIFIFSIC